MKKVIFFLCVLLPLFLFSQSISRNQLVEYAKTAYHQKEISFGQKMSDLKPKEIHYLTNNTSKDTLILLISFEEGGFMMLSAEESVYPVLAYSLEDDFDLHNIAPGARFFIEEYLSEIEMIKSKKIAPDEKTVQAWNLIKEKKMETSKSFPTPYLLSAKWDQTKYYNDYSPVDSNSPSAYDGKTPNGCVALTMAMIMYYYRFPETGRGSHTNKNKYGSFYVNFAQENYNYNAMADVLTSYNNEVAKLIFHCATSVNMMYDTEGSGAYNKDVPEALTKYFKYGNDSQLISRSNNSSQWVTILKTEINNGRPVYYSGSNSSGAHAFVCDGYDLNDLFHFNLGWGGSGNGYYRVDNSSDAAGGYSNNQSAIIGIYPSGIYPPYCTGSKVFTSYSGTLEDGSNYHNYRDNSNCTYILSPQNIIGFNVEIQYIDTEKDIDVLSFWNGDPDNGGELLLTLSGTMTNQTYYFETEILYITFKTNEENTGSGWRLNYNTIHRNPQQCRTASLRENSGVFEDGSGDNTYAPNLACYWAIRPLQMNGLEYITLNFIEFDLSPEDVVLIHDYSSNPLKEIYSFKGNDNPGTLICHTTQGIRVSFRTDNWLEKNGFKVEWRNNLATATEDNIKNQVLVFPNPSSQQFYIQFPNAVDGNWNATLFDVTGRILLTESIPVYQNSLHSLNVENIPAGFYWVKLQNEREEFTKKIVIQK